MVMTPNAADRTSWHSGRVTLASGLGLDQQPPTRIMEMCRWSAEASVATYKRLNPLQYADSIRSALRHNAVALPATKRVVTDDDEAIARLVAETTDKHDAVPQARPKAHTAKGAGKQEVPMRPASRKRRLADQDAKRPPVQIATGEGKQRKEPQRLPDEAATRHAKTSAATELRSKRACQRAEAMNARHQSSAFQC